MAKKKVARTKQQEELIAKISQALASGSYLITVSYKMKTKKSNDLQHYHLMVNYPTDDIVPAMEHHIDQLKIHNPALNPAPLTLEEVGQEWK